MTGAEIDNRAFAATWRDEDTGEIVGTTYGGTMCWRPRKPWAITIQRKGDRLIAPCGECPGCLEFARRRLADRLTKKYGRSGDAGAAAASTNSILQSAPTAAQHEQRAITIQREGDRLIAPCGECPGCLEFQRRRLAYRLVKKYPRRGSVPIAGGSTAADSRCASSATTSGRLWVVRIWYPQELQVRLSHSLHRRRGLELEPGTYRLGTDSFAILSREKCKIVQVLRAVGLRHSVEPVRPGRGRRAWRGVTAGILVARSAYGEQVKRWYVRGLPAAEKLEWEVEKIAMEKPWRRGTGARVRTARRLILVPPEVWKMGRAAFKSYQDVAAQTFSPEDAAVNRARLAALITQVAAQSILTAPPQAALTQEAVREWYAMRARKYAAGATSKSDPALSPDPSVGEGLRSSVHSGSREPAQIDAIAEGQWLHSGAPPPGLGRERDYEDWLDEVGPGGRTRRAVFAANEAAARAGVPGQRRLEAAKKIGDALESLRKKVQGG